MNILSLTGEVVETHFDQVMDDMLIELLRDLGCDVSELVEMEEMFWMSDGDAQSYATALAGAYNKIQVALHPDTSFPDGFSARLLAPGAKIKRGEHAEPLSNHPEIASWLQEVQVALSADHVFIQYEL
jgi:hypothetical protein